MCLLHFDSCHCLPLGLRFEHINHPNSLLHDLRKRHTDLSCPGAFGNALHGDVLDFLKDFFRDAWHNIAVDLLSCALVNVLLGKVQNHFRAHKCARGEGPITPEENACAAIRIKQLKMSYLAPPLKTVFLSPSSYEILIVMFLSCSAKGWTAPQHPSSTTIPMMHPLVPNGNGFALSGAVGSAAVGVWALEELVLPQGKRSAVWVNNNVCFVRLRRRKHRPQGSVLSRPCTSSVAALQFCVVYRMREFLSQMSPKDRGCGVSPLATFFVCCGSSSQLCQLRLGHAQDVPVFHGTHSLPNMATTWKPSSRRATGQRCSDELHEAAGDR